MLSVWQIPSKHNHQVTRVLSKILLYDTVDDKQKNAREAWLLRIDAWIDASFIALIAEKADESLTSEKHLLDLSGPFLWLSLHFVPAISSPPSPLNGP
jgi:hypothetical protein